MQIFFIDIMQLEMFELSSLVYIALEMEDRMDRQR